MSMGVYINGMEMPTDKNDILIFAIHSDGRVEDVMGCYIGKAVSVPPHGRLGDLDALAAQCDDPYWCVWLSDIEAAPTIIPASEEGE